jgi:hypothetical protein
VSSEKITVAVLRKADVTVAALRANTPEVK